MSATAKNVQSIDKRDTSAYVSAVRRSTRGGQIVVLLAVLVTATTFGATPAAAATTAVDATLLLPLSAGAPGLDIVYTGVSLDAGLGLGTASVGKVSLIGGCNPTQYVVTLGASDGSTVTATYGPSCVFNVLLTTPPIPGAGLSVIGFPLIVVGGTGRFVGASGSGTIQLTEITTLLTSAAVASLRLQVTS